MLRKLHHLAVKINHSALATFDNSFTDLTLLKSLALPGLVEEAVSQVGGY
jgi:hypothetical protein